MKKLLIILAVLLIIFPLVLVKGQVNFNQNHIDTIPIKVQNHVETINIKSNIINSLQKNPNYNPFTTKQTFASTFPELTNSTQVWEKQTAGINLTGKGQTICIIDTGVDYTHPDLGGCDGNNTVNSSCKVIGGWNTIDNNASILDNNGHGTHVSGIAAADGNIKGIAPNASIIMIKAGNATGSFTDQAILNGMDWCINNATKYNISVISMSLGSEGVSYSGYCDNITTINIGGTLYATDNDLFSQRINEAKAKNISVVIATGNDGNLTGVSSPACIQNAMRIGSVDKNDSVSSFTNRAGTFPDIMMTYGRDINSTMPTYPVCLTTPSCTFPYVSYSQNYAQLSGTSMSTPMAAGMILLLKQYKKLSSNETLTNDQVKSILLNSSTTINDTGATNANFSELNALKIIQYADTTPPNITYMYPMNNSLIQPNVSTNFTCNATDAIQFANITIELFNSTSKIYNASTTSQSLTVNYTLPSGNYNWSCIAKDNNSNTKTVTNLLIVNQVSTKIISPKNNTYTNQNLTSFNCSANSISNLTSMKFSIYSNNSLLFNETKNITGLSNYSEFQYNLTNETPYQYNCFALNNNSDNDTTQNYTITYDVTPPIVNLTSPANNTRTTSKTITFVPNETELNPNYCNVTINGVEKNSLTQTLTDGTYYWNITCTDLANNSNISQTRTLIIYTQPVVAGGGGSSSSTTISGGGAPAEQIYSIPNSQVTEGTIQKLRIKDKVKFNISSNEHTITVNGISQDKLNITLESTPTNFTLTKNIPTKVDLNKNGTYDLVLVYSGETNGEASLFIKHISEVISIKHILTNETNQTNITIGPQKPRVNLIKLIIKFFTELWSKIFH